MYAVYYEKPHLTICYDGGRNVGKSVWNGFVSGEAYRQSMMACVRLMTEQNVRYWIADDREMKAIRLKDQEWSNAVLMPQLANSSLKKMALVVSRDMFNQIAIDHIINQAGSTIGFEIRYFKDPKPAEAWLHEEMSQENTLLSQKKKISSTFS